MESKQRKKMDGFAGKKVPKEKELDNTSLCESKGFEQGAFWTC